MWSEERKQQARANYRYYKGRNRCVHCGRQDAYTLNGHANCAECRGNQNRFQRNRYIKYPEKKEHKNAKAVERYRERIEQGLCAKCGRTLPPDFPSKRCSVCLAKDRIRATRYREKKRDQAMPSRVDWIANGLCYLCGAPVKEGLNKRGEPHKLCESCYTKSLSSMEKARAANCLSKKNTVHPWTWDNALAFR